MQMKHAFFSSVQDLINRFSVMERVSLKFLTKFDIGALYILEGQYLKGLYNCMYILGSPIGLIRVYSKGYRKETNAKVSTINK